MIRQPHPCAAHLQKPPMFVRFLLPGVILFSMTQPGSLASSECLFVSRNFERLCSSHSYQKWKRKHSGCHFFNCFRQGNLAKGKIYSRDLRTYKRQRDISHVPPSAMETKIFGENSAGQKHKGCVHRKTTKKTQITVQPFRTWKCFSLSQEVQHLYGSLSVTWRLINVRGESTRDGMKLRPPNHGPSCQFSLSPLPVWALKNYCQLSNFQMFSYILHFTLSYLNSAGKLGRNFPSIQRGFRFLESFCSKRLDWGYTWPAYMTTQ